MDTVKNAFSIWSITNRAHVDGTFTEKHPVNRDVNVPFVTTARHAGRSSDMETENYENGGSSGFISGLYYIGCQAVCTRTRAAETRAI